MVQAVKGLVQAGEEFLLIRNARELQLAFQIIRPFVIEAGDEASLDVAGALEKSRAAMPAYIVESGRGFRRPRVGHLSR